MAEHLDKLLDRVGADGRYQKLLVFLFLGPINFFAGFMNNQLLFEVVVPEHWCHVPTPANTSLTAAQWRNITIPRTEGGQYSSCLMYDVVETRDSSRSSITITNTTSPCKFGWDYDSAQFQATVATSFGWFCDRGSYSQHVMAVTMAGNAMGSLLLPQLSDKYLGRRVMLLLAPTLYVVFTVSSVFISLPVVHLALRFLAALAYPVWVSIPLILVVEVVKCEWRSLITGLTYISYTLGISLTSLVAYLLPHWQVLALLSCLPHVLAPLYWWYVPESPRWLLSKGRTMECCRILQRISVINGRGEVSRQEVELLLSTKQDKAPHLHQVLRYPILRCRIFRLFMLGGGLYISYGVVMMGINIMPSNYFLSLLILTLIQLPGDAFSWVLAEFLGRRFTVISGILIAAIFSFSATFCLHNELLLVVVTGVVRLALATCMQTLYVVVPELLPTPIRASGFGIYCTFNSATMVFSPYLVSPELSAGFRYWSMLSFLAVSLVAVMTIPETVGLPLPQDFMEAEHLGSGRPLTTWINHWNHHKYRSNKCPTPANWSQDTEKQDTEPLKTSSPLEAVS